MGENNQENTIPLTKKVRVLFSELSDAGQDKVKKSIELGLACQKLRKKPAVSKKGWLEYLDEKLPEVDIRKAQRYQKIAKVANLGKYPMLCHLSLRTLYTLANKCSVSEEEGIGELLEEHDVDATDEDQDPKEFKDNIDSILNHDKRGGKNKKKKGDQLLDAIVKLNKTMDLLETDQGKFAETSQERKDELRKPISKLIERLAEIKVKLNEAN